MAEVMICPIEENVDTDPAAEQHEAKVQAEQNAQFLELKRQAQGTFDTVKGRRGARNEEYWQEIMAKAKSDYSCGNFLIGRLGACRQLDLPLAATVLQLRQGLLEGIHNPTTGDHMLADTAIIAYFNLVRIQGVIGSLCLETQRELFGQRSVDTIVGSVEAAAIIAQVERLGHTLLPLEDRCQRMLTRALDRLETRRTGRSSAAVCIGAAEQVNVGSMVQNIIAEKD